MIAKATKDSMNIWVLANSFLQRSANFACMVSLGTIRQANEIVYISFRSVKRLFLTAKPLGYLGILKYWFPALDNFNKVITDGNECCYKAGIMKSESDLMKYRHLLIGILLIGSMNLGSQDFHNSFIQFAPMTISPTLTGAYYGNLRATVIGRDQGQKVSPGNQWRDFNVSVDTNIDFGFTDGDWVSGGINFVRSQVGTTSFTRQFSGLALAYHLAFGKDEDKVFSVGFKYGNYSTKFGMTNPDDLSSPASLAAIGSQDITQLIRDANDPNNEGKSSGDYNVGFMLTSPVGKSSDVRIGISADHMFSPRLTLGQNNSGPDTIPMQGFIAEELDRRINGFIYYYTSLSDKLVFNPNILYQKMGASTNILIQGLVNYLISPKKDITLITGIGVRIANSMDFPLYLGADIKSWRVGLSYDTNVTGLRPSNNTFGALELGISKIFSWSKPAVVKPVFICPRL